MSKESDDAVAEAFRAAKLGEPLTPHQLRIVQFLGAGFGCHACALVP